MSDPDRIAIRLRPRLVAGAVAQVLVATLIAAAASILGAPRALVATLIGTALALGGVQLRERRLHGGPRPRVFFLTLAAAAGVGYLALGLLESPLAPALGTLSVGLAAVAPSLRFARIFRAVALVGLALGLAAHLAWPGVSMAPGFVDRQAPGVGFYVGNVALLGVLVMGAVLGGFTARQLRLALDEVEAVEALSRSEHLASLDVRTRDLMLLTGNLAQGLGGPLSDVAALAARIAERTPDVAVRERLGVLSGEVARIRERLAQYTTFARTERREPVELADCLDEVHAAVRGLLEPRGLRLTLEGGARVVTDRAKLFEVLENLVQNAIEASPVGATITLRAAQEGDGARVEVLDEGPGLEHDALARLFEPGFTTKAQGSGLGLVLSRRIAEQLGGSLELGNRAPGGCTATLRLPSAARPSTPPPVRV